MTLQEAKNEATYKVTWGQYNDYDLLINHAGGGMVGTHVLLAVHETASELYARSKWQEACEAQKNICFEAVNSTCKVVIDSSPKPEFKP